MSQKNNGNEDNGTGSGTVAPKVPWGTKVGYIGTGVLIGLIAYPFVRKALGKIQPKMDKMFDDLTGKAEEYAEKASDLLAKAKQTVRQDRGPNGHDHHHHHETQREGET